MSIQKQSNRGLSQSGSTHIFVILAVLVVLAIIGVAIYVGMKNSKDSDKSSKSTQSETSTSATTSTTSVKLLGGNLTLGVVDGWEKGTEQNLIKDIDGTSFRIAVQAQGVDYLKLDTVGGYATEVSTVKTTQGTTLHILKLGKTADATNYVVSSCAPSNGFGCAPDFDGKKLYITLAPLGDGGTAIAPLDYSLPATTQAIADFLQIVKTLPL